MNKKIYLAQKAFKKFGKKVIDVFICGNGGSAGNAIHIANDFIYGTANCGKWRKS